MNPFGRLKSVGLPLLEDGIDTDILFPARFLLFMQRDGLGDYFCHDRRVAPDGSRIAGNPIDDPRFAGTRILVAGDDFGCGSSREQAVWAMTGFGVRAVIAMGLGEIFAANCLRNGVLAIALPRATVEAIARAAGPIEIDLERQTIWYGGQDVAFAIRANDKLRLLNGWDDVDTILEQESTHISAFEGRQRHEQPWLYEVCGD